jgi:phosphoribosylformylglycinamidine synthase
MVNDMEKPRALVLIGFGINAEAELAHALELGGAIADFVHFNQLLKGNGALLESYQLLALPGGFSFGDDIQAGRVLANKFKYKLYSPLKQFIDSGKPVLGICNGFQVLTQLGALPGWESKGGQFGWERRMTLARNSSARFENRWVYLRCEKSACPFSQYLPTLWMPVRHGEGRVTFLDEKDLERLKDNMQVVFRYADEVGEPALDYPLNPNGSAYSIAGVCNPQGNVLGMMPHPECHIRYTQSPIWTANPPQKQEAKSSSIFQKIASAFGLMPKEFEPADEGNCLPLFKNIVEYAKKF